MVFRSFSFFKGMDEPGVSNRFVNTMSADGSIEIKGTATAFSLEIQGAADDEDENNIEWHTLCAINESDLSVVSEIDAKGIYSVDTLGKSIRVKINSISGGNLTVFGKFSN